MRNAISVGPVGGGRHAIYFGDILSYMYALDAVTGELLWKVKVEDHPLAVITGAPTLHEGRLYVPVSSREEAAGGSLFILAARSAAASSRSTPGRAAKSGRGT